MQTFGEGEELESDSDDDKKKAKKSKSVDKKMTIKNKASFNSKTLKENIEVAPQKQPFAIPPSEDTPQIKKKNSLSKVQFD